MSQREDKTVDQSIKTIPDETGYVAVPLPPRIVESAGSPRSGIVSRLRKIRFRRKARAPLTRSEKIRKRDFEQAAAIAVIVNLLILVPILFITIKIPAVPRGSYVTLQSGGENPANQKKSDFTEDSSGQAQAAPTELMTGAAFSKANGSEAVAISNLESQLTPRPFAEPLLSFGRSVASYEMGGVPGVDKSLLESLFPKSKFGNGSRLAIFVDDSKSMRKINEAVASYVRIHFRHSFVRIVDNCKMGSAEDSFAIQLAHVALSSACTDFVFVCDLQDRQTEGGINFIRKFLTERTPAKRLHLISFDRRPRTHLAKLIESSGGTFTLVDLK